MPNKQEQINELKKAITTQDLEGALKIINQTPTNNLAKIINTTDDRKNTVTHLVAVLGDTPQLKSLLEKNPNLLLQNSFDETPFDTLSRILKDPHTRLSTDKRKVMEENAKVLSDATFTAKIRYLEAQLVYLIETSAIVLPLSKLEIGSGLIDQFAKGIMIESSNSGNEQLYYPAVAAKSSLALMQKGPIAAGQEVVNGLVLSQIAKSGITHPSLTRILQTTASILLLSSKYALAKGHVALAVADPAMQVGVGLLDLYLRLICTTYLGNGIGGTFDHIAENFMPRENYERTERKDYNSLGKVFGAGIAAIMLDRLQLNRFPANFAAHSSADPESALFPALLFGMALGSAIGIYYENKSNPIHLTKTSVASSAIEGGLMLGTAAAFLMNELQKMWPNSESTSFESSALVPYTKPDNNHNPFITTVFTVALAFACTMAYKNREMMDEILANARKNTVDFAASGVRAVGLSADIVKNVTVGISSHVKIAGTTLRSAVAFAVGRKQQDQAIDQPTL